MKRSLFSLFCFCFVLATKAQEKWSLQQCVAWAMANNISVKTADIQSRLASVSLKQSEAGRLPDLNFGTSAGYNFGRSINPTTNTFENRSIFFSNLQLQSNVTLFNWFSRRYAIEASQLDLKAAQAAKDKASNDVALNVAVAYLQALLANEQVEVGVLQINQTTTQLETIRKQVKAGSLPELNAVELEAQLARDSATYIGAVATFQQNMILLKAILNLDMATPFDIQKPDVSAIPVLTLDELQPELVYQQALQNLPQQRVNQFRYESALKNVSVARASMYPTLSAFASIGSNYSSAFPDEERVTATPNGKFDTLGFVEVTPGVQFPAVRPRYDVVIPNTSLSRQLFDVNLRQAIGINLSIPIFNNRQLRSAWERSKLNAENVKLQMTQDNQTLQQDIYTAYTNALSARQRYEAARKGVEAAEKAYGFSQKRFTAGLLSTLELITNQTNLYRSRLDALSARYEFVFRMKLLEFYKGKGIRL